MLVPAFGVMLFEMLAGKHPFEGDTLAALTYAIMTKPIPDLEAIRPDAPIALIDLIYRMLAKTPDERISSVRLIGAALEGIISGVDTPIRPAIRSPLPIEDQDLTFQMTTPLSTSKTHSNLPSQTTAFIGREDELTELTRLLSQPMTRLITIVGPGGMGKTRLSLETAEREIDHFANGVYLVELAPLNTAENIIPTLAEALGYQFQQDGRDSKQQLSDYLREKHLLLVLDNFEHLLDGVGIVADILKTAPHVKIMATSRERLNLTSETFFTLDGLDFPDWETPEDAMNYSAVKLFMQSAQRAQPGFELKTDDLVYVVSRRLSGYVVS
jgi:hypothetical protein